MHTADRGGILLESHDHADDNGFREYNDVRLLTMAVKFFSPGTQHWGEDVTQVLYGLRIARGGLSQILSEDKNIFRLKVAISGFFCFIGTSSYPEPRTRTCTDCRTGQEHEPITD